MLAGAVAVGAVAVHMMQQVKTEKPAPVVSSKPVVAEVTAIGRLEPQGEVRKLSAPSTAINARVDQVLVKEGQRVKAGDVIAILDSRDRLQAALDKAKRDVELSQAKLAKIKAGAQVGEIEAQKATIVRLQAQLVGEREAAIATLESLKAQLKGQKETLQATIARIDAQKRNADVDYQRYVSLYKEGGISAQELGTRRLNAVTATQQLNENQATRRQTIATLEQQIREAQANLFKTEGTLQQQIVEAKATLNKITEIRPTDVQEAQAQVDSSMAAVKQAEADLALAYVKAPIPGEILKIYTKPGASIGTDGIADMGRTDQMVAVAEVYESDISKVRLGQKAAVASDNDTFSKDLKGVVIEVGRRIGKQNTLDSDPAADQDARVVEVRIALENSQIVSGLTNGKVKVRINI